MMILQQGVVGPNVKMLQIYLNRHLMSGAKLAIDGRFGSKTKAAVIAFQVARKLKADGIVGPKTWRVLQGGIVPVADAAVTPAPAPIGAVQVKPPPGPIPANMAKFVKQLGIVDDFVAHVRLLEIRHKNDRHAVMRDLQDFIETGNKVRYLIMRDKNKPGIIDFRHFFAAASITFVSHNKMRSLGGSQGETLLLGLCNEIAQCVDEVTRWQINSCFSSEDLLSNNLGARFGEILNVSGATRVHALPSDLLRNYLNRLDPAPPQAVRQAKMAGKAEVALEAITALLLGVYDFLVPSAY